MHSAPLLYEDLPEEAPRPKRAKYSVPLSLHQSGAFQQVPASLLELPYRGIFTHEEASTYNTHPDKEAYALYARLKQAKPSKRGLGSIHFDNFVIDTWFTAPYPPHAIQDESLHVCHHCLSYFSSAFQLGRHQKKCSARLHPPGQEIYRDPVAGVALFEVDARKNVLYAQNLCLLAKLFLNSKTLYYDVEPFVFYVLYEYSAHGFKFVGYFSKEKLNGTGYNLSCIMTLPIYQRKGYGTFLIDMSYLLSRREFKLGTPEKPLSHLGLLSYRAYWRDALVRAIMELSTQMGDLECWKISIDDLANLTGMCHDDVVVGLEQLEALTHKNGTYSLTLNRSYIEARHTALNKRRSLKVDPSLLVWKPVILGPSGGINTNSTMVVTNEVENGLVQKQPLKDISLILNFLYDDAEDDRDLEEQTMAKVLEQQQNTGEILDAGVQDDSPPLVCYPGLKSTLRVLGKTAKAKEVKTPPRRPMTPPRLARAGTEVEPIAVDDIREEITEDDAMEDQEQLTSDADADYATPEEGENVDDEEDEEEQDEEDEDDM